MAKLEENIISMWSRVQYVCGEFAVAANKLILSKNVDDCILMRKLRWVGALAVHFPTMMHSSFIPNVCYVDTTMGGFALRCSFG